MCAALLWRICRSKDSLRQLCGTQSSLATRSRPLHRYSTTLDMLMKRHTTTQELQFHQKCTPIGIVRRRSPKTCRAMLSFTCLASDAPVIVRLGSVPVLGTATLCRTAGVQLSTLARRRVQRTGFISDRTDSVSDGSGPEMDWSGL